MGSLLVKVLGFPATLIHGDPLVLDRWLWLKKRLPSASNGENLIDVGCGSGAFTIGAALRGYKSLGLSWDERNQRVARERALICDAPLAEFEVFDVRKLDQREDLFSKFDVALNFENIEHILDDRKLMQDIAKCIKPGGRLLLTTPYDKYRPISSHDAGPFSPIEDGGHVRKGYSEERLIELCNASGLDFESCSFCSGFLSQKLAFLLRLLTNIHPLFAWAVTLPLRILPPVFDPMISKLNMWPQYSICLEANKPLPANNEAFLDLPPGSNVETNGASKSAKRESAVMMAPLIEQASSAEKGASLIPLVDISVGSRFWAFDLARELNSYGMLRLLHTGYPAFLAKRFDLPYKVIHSVYSQEPLNRVSSFLYRQGIVKRSFDFALSDRFDRIVARRLRPGADIFVGWSSQCLRSLEKAATYGMVTIVERGSTHIEWQRATLQTEAERTGLPTEIPDSRTVERELAEYETADFIAVPSRFVARTFAEYGIKQDRLIVNPYGVDLQRFGMQARHKNQQELRVIHVGQVSVRKGVHYLVPAVEKVKGATLTLVGAIQPGMKSVVSRSCTRIIGPVPGADLPSFYAAADVFCLLSIEEGLALVILQAMAMGLPVIATPNTGAEEVITDGEEGFIVEARDSNTVTERLQWLSDHEDQRVEMGRRAQAKVAEGFSWTDYGARARSAYQSILVARNTHRAQ